MCCSSTGFWFFGVNLRLHLVQYLNLLIPCVFVCLTPLRVVFWQPQYGHLNGLPLAIDITSCDTCGGPELYKSMLLPVSDNLMIATSVHDLPKNKTIK